MKKGKISNVNLAADISKIVEGSKAPTPVQRTSPVFEHMQHAYDKDAKIMRQACMKAAASSITSAKTDKPEEIANRIISVAELLYEWVNK